MAAVDLAQNTLDGLMIVADPTKTEDDAPQIAKVLSDRLGLDYIDTVEVLTDSEREDGTANHFGYVARRVPSEQARAALRELEELKIKKGIDTRWDPVRSYPGKDVGANLLGFMNRLGQAGGGLEMVYDSMLKGKDGHATYDVGVASWMGSPAGLPLTRLALKAYAMSMGYRFNENTNRYFDVMITDPATVADDEQEFKVYLPITDNVPANEPAPAPPAPAAAAGQQ